MSNKRKTYRAPSWLSDEAKVEWRRAVKLLDHSRFKEQDLTSLEAYCQSYSKWRECEIILNNDGLTFETPNGYIQQRPEVSISNTAFTNMQSIAKELGFTPASRIRMDKNKGEASAGADDEVDEDLEFMIRK